MYKWLVELFTNSNNTITKQQIINNFYKGDYEAK